MIRHYMGYEIRKCRPSRTVWYRVYLNGVFIYSYRRLRDCKKFIDLFCKDKTWKPVSE